MRIRYRASQHRTDTLAFLLIRLLKSFASVAGERSFVLLGDRFMV